MHAAQPLHLKPMQTLNKRHQRQMISVYRCLHCTCGGKLCLNRNMRMLNFALDTQREAEANGAKMLARVAASLFEVVRQTREWEAEHMAVIDAHFHTIRDLAAAQTPLPGETAQQMQHAPDLPLEAWVDWLEQVGKRLIREYKSSFACIRRNRNTTDCEQAESCSA